MIKTGKYTLSTLLQNEGEATALRDKVVDKIPKWVGVDSWLTQQERTGYQVLHLNYDYDPDDEETSFGIGGDLHEHGDLRSYIDHTVRFAVGLKNEISSQDLPVHSGTDIPRI